MKKKKQRHVRPIERQDAKRPGVSAFKTASPGQGRTSLERAGGDPGSLLAMQRSLGNRAVQRLLHSRAGQAYQWAGGISPVVQRQIPKAEIPATGKAPPAGGVTKIFAVMGPLFGTGFVRNMATYFEKTLGQKATTVRGLDQMFSQLLALKRSRVKVSRLIIVIHGAASGKVKGGGIKKPLVGPQDLQKNLKAIQVRKHIMAKGAAVEFWACNVGKAHSTLKKWSQLFGAEVRATPGKLGIERRVFSREPLTSRELSAKSSRLLSGTAKIMVQNTSEVYGIQKPKSKDYPMPYWQKRFNTKKQKLIKRFERQLLKWYSRLIASREIRETKHPRNKAQKLDYMRKLFNRSGGVIRYVHIRTTKGKFRPIRRPRRKWRAWLKLWKRARFSSP